MVAKLSLKKKKVLCSTCSYGVFIIASEGLQNIRLSMALHSEQEGIIFGAIYAWKLSTLTYSNQAPGSWKNLDLSLKFI